MTPKERDAIEAPREFSDRPKPDVMHERCVACGCPVGDHWAKLHGDAIGWVGCTVALIRKMEGAA